MQPLEPELRQVVADAVGSPVAGVEELWERPHALRITLADGRTVVGKRLRAPDEHRTAEQLRHGFDAERSALEHLAAMPGPRIVPRFLAASGEPALLVMEELPPGPSLAHSLLEGDAASAGHDLVAFAESLARLHRWSAGTEADLAAVRRRQGLPADTGPWWGVIAERGTDALVETATERLGLDAAGVADDGRRVVATVRHGGPFRGLVHGDPCPDNTRIVDGEVVLFDFELSAYGSVLLDASYFVAPFPTCWCFAAVPDDVAGRAVDAYRAALGGPAADDDLWDRGLVHALAAWLLGRGEVLRRALDDDREWGTTTTRPRLLRWLDAYLDVARRVPDELPALTRLVADLRPRLGGEWPGAAPVPTYPAFAAEGRPAVPVPGFWADMR